MVVFRARFYWEIQLQFLATPSLETGNIQIHSKIITRNLLIMYEVFGFCGFLSQIEKRIYKLFSKLGQINDTVFADQQIFNKIRKLSITTKQT